jgi:NADPH:quinone reductase-like Zn-dependent oxidoreductase
MRAIVIKENTSQIPCPSETNDPQPTNAQVVVDVHSTALNFFDVRAMYTSIHLLI